MSYRIATRNQWISALFLILGLTALLTVGFIPTSREFFRLVAHLIGSTDGSGLVFKLGERMSFPVLAALFLVSLPRTGERARRPIYRRLADHRDLLFSDCDWAALRHVSKLHLLSISFGSRDPDSSISSGISSSFRSGRNCSFGDGYTKSWSADGTERGVRRQIHYRLPFG